MKKSNNTGGVLLIAIGIFILLGRYTDISLSRTIQFWPIIILLIGIVLEITYFGRRDNPGTLVPAGILMILGILFIFETTTNWSFSNYTWPIYLIAVAFGLFQLYWFGKRDNGLLVPISILLLISLSAYMTFILGTSIFYIFRIKWIFPIILIISGGMILYRNRK